MGNITWRIFADNDLWACLLTVLSKLAEYESMVPESDALPPLWNETISFLLVWTGVAVMLNLWTETKNKIARRTTVETRIGAWRLLVRNELIHNHSHFIWCVSRRFPWLSHLKISIIYYNTFLSQDLLSLHFFRQIWGIFSRSCVLEVEYYDHMYVRMYYKILYHILCTYATMYVKCM